RRRSRVRVTPGPPFENQQKGITMPKQIYDVDKFLEMTEDAVECRVKRSSDQVKLKLRTARYLYTLVVEPQKAEEILQQVKCQVVEARPMVEEA
ncbi:MAG: eL38 family ribosomal protein, partial [Candidatus Thorarchaeota archaeon]